MFAAIALAAGLTTSVIPAPSSSSALTRLYDNTGNPANAYYGAQGGAEVLDDLHLASGGMLDTLVVEYFDPALAGTLSATVKLYDNPGGLDLGATLLAGPFVVTGLPRGRGAVAIPLSHALAVGPNLWVGVQFTSTTAGWILRGTPAVGSSHDLYLENGNLYWFGGDPKANFGVRLVGTAASVSVGGDPPSRLALAPARPNPFHRGTTLDYSTGRRGPVRLDVLDVAGRRVRSLVNDVRDAGRHTEPWTGRDDTGHILKAGVYFVRLEAAGTVVTRRMVFAP